MYRLSLCLNKNKQNVEPPIQNQILPNKLNAQAKIQLNQINDVYDKAPIQSL